MHFFLTTHIIIIMIMTWLDVIGMKTQWNNIKYLHTWLSFQDCTTCPMRNGNGHAPCAGQARYSSSIALKLSGGEEWLTAKTLESALNAAACGNGNDGSRFVAGNTSTGMGWLLHLILCYLFCMQFQLYLLYCAIYFCCDDFFGNWFQEYLRMKAHTRSTSILMGYLSWRGRMWITKALLSVQQMNNSVEQKNVVIHTS